jgi:hypothetical protein
MLLLRENEIKVLFVIILELIMELIRVGLEVEKESSSLQKMVLSMKELGKTIICGVTVDLSLKISITKGKSETELLME